VEALVAEVTVTDKIQVSCVVTAAQALAWCRRELVERRGWKENAISLDHFGAAVSFMPPDGDDLDCIIVPTLADAAWLADVCDDIAMLGIVRQPSAALRAMASEEVGP
jgi:hypothetical protein